MGDYDMVGHLNAPNEESVAKFVLGLATLGNVRTKTLKAFSEDASASTNAWPSSRTASGAPNAITGAGIR